MEEMDLETRAERLRKALDLMKPVREATNKAMIKIADELDLHPCDLDMIYHSDMLEFAIAIATTMGIEVDIEGFFETMKAAIEYKTEKLMEKNP